MIAYSLPAPKARMDLETFLKALGGLGGSAAAIFGGYWSVRRMLGVDKRSIANDGSAIAASDATTAVIERLERHLSLADDRANQAVARADKAERERNEALNRIDQMSFTLQTLRDEVRKSREETQHAREEVQTLRQELQKYAKQ